MRVTRRVRVKPKRYEIGDQINIKLKDGRKFSATCHKRESDCEALFVFDQVVDRRPMNDNGGTKGGYLESDMRNWLHIDFYPLLPGKIKRYIVRDNGDYIRLLYAYEVFGDDYPWEHDEIPDEQLPLMKYREYRVAFDSDNDIANWWLRDVAYSTNVAAVNANGGASAFSASYSIGVRPAFVIRDPQSPPLVGGPKEGETVYSEF